MRWRFWTPRSDDLADADEVDARRVPLRPYFVARYPVTVAQWVRTWVSTEPVKELARAVGHDHGRLP